MSTRVACVFPCQHVLLVCFHVNTCCLYVSMSTHVACVFPCQHVLLVCFHVNMCSVRRSRDATSCSFTPAASSFLTGERERERERERVRACVCETAFQLGRFVDISANSKDCIIFAHIFSMLQFFTWLTIRVLNTTLSNFLFSCRGTAQVLPRLSRHWCFKCGYYCH